MGQAVTPTIEIVAMAPRDIPAVVALDEQVYPNPWSVATWRKELAAPDRFHLVAFTEDGAGPSVVGHAGLLFMLDEAHVTTVAVHPDHGGRGLGSRLLLRLLDEATLEQAAAATLEVRAADRRTQRIYGRFGFRPAGIRSGYYSKPTDDAVVMWLHELCAEPAQLRLDELREALFPQEFETGQGAIDEC